MRENKTIWCLLLLVTVPVLAGCQGLLWPFENPEDEWRCDPDCPGGQKCENGTCVTAMDGGAKLDQTSNCGNQKLDTGEQCDGNNLAGQTCVKLKFDGGSLSCRKDCKLDKTKCTYASCGNGKKDGKDQCEGQDLGGQTCMSRGYYKGNLNCHKNCTFNESECSNCGNGLFNSGEDCDGGKFGGKTCISYGYHFGALKCNFDCTIDKSMCKYNDQALPDSGGPDLNVMLCYNKALDGDETDVDCGGFCPKKCDDGKKCKTSTDCASGICDATSLICTAPSCTDTVKNGNETDTDCGGGICPACATGKMCWVATDCASNFCDTSSFPYVCK